MLQGFLLKLVSLFLYYLCMFVYKCFLVGMLSLETNLEET